MFGLNSPHDSSSTDAGDFASTDFEASQAYSKIQFLLNKSDFEVPMTEENNEGYDSPHANDQFQQTRFHKSTPARAHSFSLGVGGTPQQTPDLYNIYPDENNVSSSNISILDKYTKHNSRPSMGINHEADGTMISMPPPTSNSFLHTNITEQTFESRLHPDEGIFHDILQQFMYKKDDVITGARAIDNAMQSEIAERYAAAADSRHQELARVARAKGMAEGDDAWAISSTAASKDSAGRREHDELRAERDMWSLLAALTASNLIDDVDEARCEESLNKALDDMSIDESSLPDYVNAAYASDLRLRKGFVLKSWVERAALNEAREVPVPCQGPADETLQRILRAKKAADRNLGNKGGSAQAGVQSIHGDAQLLDTGYLAPLDGVDAQDQEALLRLIWQHIRSGQVMAAADEAQRHRVFWLSACLLGVSSHEYVKTGAEPGEGLQGVARVGNAKQPLWTKTCWQYAQQLAGHQDNWKAQGTSGTETYRAHTGDTSLAGVWEMTIFAALANHTNLLIETPALHSWHDRLWVFVKAVHERDLMRVTHRYRIDKHSHSELFPGCDPNTIVAERELIKEASAHIQHLTTGDCKHLLQQTALPTSKTRAQALVQQLQAAAMQGRSGIKAYIADTMLTYLLPPTPSQSSDPSHAFVLRIYCHFTIWLRFSPSAGLAQAQCSDLSDLVSDDLLFLAVERYADHLIEKKQRSLVALYMAFLNRTRRIEKYAELLLSLPTSAANLQQLHVHALSGQSLEAADTLEKATHFFPSDVMLVIQRVIDMTSGRSSLHSYLAPACHSKCVPNLKVVAFVDSADPADTAGSSSFSSPPSPACVSDGITPQKGSLPAEDEYRSLRGRKATPRLRRPVSRKAQAGLTLPRLSFLDDNMDGPASSGVSNSDKNNINGNSGSQRGFGSSSSSLVGAMDRGKGQRVHRRMEVLRWLLFDPAHRVEAVKQTNRLIVDILLESGARSTSQLRSILMDYLPLDSVTIGFSLMDQFTAELNDMIEFDQYERSERRRRREAAEKETDGSAGFLDDIDGDSESDNVVQARRGMGVERMIWSAALAKLELWKSFLGASEDLDVFHALLAEFQHASNRIVGSVDVVQSTLARITGRVLKAADTVTNAIMRTLLCVPYSSDSLTHGSSASGFGDVWAQAEEGAVASIVYVIDDLVLKMGDSMAGNDQDVREGARSDPSPHPLTEQYDEFVRLANGVFGADGRPVPPSVSIALQSLQRVIGVGMAFDDDRALLLRQALSVCVKQVLDVVDSRQLARVLANKLLTSYLQVCVQTAAAMKALGEDKQEGLYYGKAVQLANTIATEDYSLQLYSMLDKGDLEALLSSINTACLNLLRLERKLHFDDGAVTGVEGLGDTTGYAY